MIDEKSSLERIAVALEARAGITHQDDGYLDDKSYLERIAIALETLNGDNSDLK